MSAGCHYCGEQSHGKRQCALFQQHLVNGILKENSSGLMVGPDDVVLAWRPGQMHEVAMRRYNEWKSQQTPAQTNNHQYTDEAQVENTQPFFTGVDNGREEPSLVQSNLHEYVANTATMAPERKNEVRSNNPFLVDVNEKRKGTPTPGETQGPPKKTRATAQMEDRMEEEADPSDGELTPGVGENERPKRKPQTHRNLSRAEEEFSVAQMVQFGLKHATINLNLEQWAGMSKEVARELCRHLKPRKVPIVGPIGQANHAGAPESDEEDNKAYYTHALPIVEVEAQGKQFKALIDTGSELDMISLQVFKVLGVPLRRDGMHKVIGINNRPERLHGICESLKVTIGGITNTIHPFVREGLTYDMLLGMPTIARFQMVCRMGQDGQAWIQLKNQEGVKVQTWPSNATTRRTELTCRQTTGGHLQPAMRRPRTAPSRGGATHVRF